MSGPRIVSLLPSATEIVCALGAAPELVGVSHECDFPPTVSDRAVLTRSRIGPGASSLAIDAAVREVVRDALSIYEVDEALLASLDPDVIVTQDLCEVCAVSLDDVKRAVGRLVRRDEVRLVSLAPTRLDEIFGDVDRIARAIGREDEGAAVRAGLEGRVTSIARRAAQSRVRPRVVSLEWLDPLMLGGMWMPELVSLAGGVAIGSHTGEPAPTVSPRDLAALEPDVIVAKPCGFSLARALEERDVLERGLAFVAPTARVYVTDGNALFNRPGPRVVESLEVMAACVHPERFEDFAGAHAPMVVRLR